MFIKPLYILQEGKASYYMTEINIDNIVCFIETNEPMDLEFLKENISEASYNPDEFEGISIKYDLLKTASIILPNGKIISTGAKDFDDAKKTINKTIDKINKTGLSIKKDLEIEIENVVASTDLNKELHLSSISDALIFQNSTYKPEEFPGLILRKDDSCIDIILFNSGKVVCVGAKKIEEAIDVLVEMKEKLSSIGVL